MKKLTAFILALVLLLQTIPITAAVETLLTDTELTSAAALAGFGENSPHYKPGMPLSETMTARQLMEYVDDVMTGEIHTLENYYEDLENTLYLLKTRNPAAYAAATTGTNEGMAEKVHTLFHQTEKTRSKLEYWRARLDAQTTEILNSISLLPNEKLTEYERRLCAHRIENAVAEIRSIRSEMVAEAKDHHDGLTEQLQLFKKSDSAYGLQAAGGSLSDWAGQVLDGHPGEISETSVSTASLFPKRTTFLGHLSPISTAEADTNQNARVLVADENHVYFKLKDENDNDLKGVNVKVVDAMAENNPHSFEDTSDEDGFVSVPIAGFELDDDMLELDVTFSMDGYRKVIAGKLSRKKGGSYTQIMVKDDGTPYLAECAFDGHDCMINEYTALYSTANDRQFDIRVTMVNPSDTHYVLHAIYEQADKDEESGAKQYYYSREIPAGKETTLKFNKAWRSLLKPGGAQYELKIDNKEEKSAEDEKRVLLFALENSGDTPASDGASKAGMPSLKAGGYTLMKSQLRMEAAKLSQPLDGVPKNAAFLSKMSGFADISFPMNIGGKVFPSGSAGFDLPFADFTPRLNFAIDGSFSIFIGKDVGDWTGAKGPIAKWQSSDAKQIKDKVDNLNKKYAFQQKRQKGYAEYQMQRQPGGVKVGNVAGSFGIFAGLVFTIEYSEDRGEWVSKNLQGVIGGAFSLSVDFHFDFMAGVFPITVGFNVSASLGISFSLGGECSINSDVKLTGEAVRSVGFDPKLGGFDIFFKLMVTGFIGFGTKGFISATVNAYGYFNVLFRVDWEGTRTVRFTGGGGFYILLEAVFVHARFNIWDSDEKVIYEGKWPKEKAQGLPFSDLFMSRASADEAEPEEPMPYTATDYPELVPDVTLEYGPTDKMSNGMQVVEVGDSVFTFSVVPGSGSNGSDRVVWRNLESGKTGTFETALRNVASSGYRFRRNRQDGSEQVETKMPPAKGTRTVDLSQLEEVWSRDRLLTNMRSLYGNNDIYFNVAKADANNSRALGPVFGELFTLTVLSGRVVQNGDDAQFSGTPEIYVLGFMPDGKGGLTADLPSILNEEEVNPTAQLSPFWGRGRVEPSTDLTWNLLWNARITLQGDELQALLRLPLTSSAVFQDRQIQQADYYEYTVQVTAAIGGFLTSFMLEVPNIHRTFQDIFSFTDTYKRILWGNQPGAQATIPEISGDRVQTSSTRKVNEPNYYSVEKAENGNEQLWYKSNYCGCVIDEEQNISYYRVLPGDDYDMVFYLVQEVSEDGDDQNHLNAAKIQHYRNDPTKVAYTFTDLDVTIPGAGFQLQNVAGTTYAYWLESSKDPEDSTKGIYRVRAVAYDPNSGVGSDDFVLAQFRAPAGQTINNLLFTKEGKGYYVISTDSNDGGSSSVYSFPFKLIAAVDLDGVILDDDVIHKGEYDTVMLRVTNNGNLAISSFSISESVLDGGKASTVLTAHVDMLKNENSWLHLEGDDHSLDITGKEAIWRTEPPLDNLTQTYWKVEKTTRTFSSVSSYSDKKETVSMDAMELLPGQVGFYYMIIHTPSEWDGKKDLRFEIEEFKASVNHLRSMALRSGVAMGVNAAEPGEITWSRNGNHSLKATNNSGIYAVMSGTPKGFTLVHDLDNLVVKHRVYVTPYGERWLSFTLNNDAADYGQLRVTCAVYLDGSETPIYMDLPYDPQSTSHERAHTFDMPVSSLANGKKAKKAKVVILGIGNEEMGVLDNMFEVDLDDSDPLRIVVQPQSRTALEGETVTMSVKAAGGNPPYEYRWQEYMGESLGWRTIEGAAGDTLTLEKVTLGMNGRHYRCVVTDRSLDSVVSDEAVLTIRKVLPTGDASRPILILAGSVILAVLWILLRRKRKDEV